MAILYESMTQILENFHVSYLLTFNNVLSYVKPGFLDSQHQCSQVEQQSSVTLTILGSVL